jgi:hypothetical protein
MANMLTLVQDFCGTQNLPVPATVYGTTDPQVRQIMKLLEAEGRDLNARGGWQGTTFEASHTSLAQEDQGAISTIASNGFKYIKNETIWDRTTILPVCGPMDGKSWQAMKALVVTGPRFRYRIRGGKLLVNPTPPASDSWYFEYASENWILGVDGTTYKSRFTLDTDTILLPADICLAGLEWRWLRKKGLDYAEEFRTYELQVKDALGRDGGKPTLYMDENGRGPSPGIFVPGGSWSVP